MYLLAPERKKYLLRQNRLFRSTSASTQATSNGTNNQGYAASYGPASGSTLLPKIIPTLTGDQAPGGTGIMKRFSIAGIWGGAASPSSQVPAPTPIPEALHALPPEIPPFSPAPAVPEALPIVPQITGSLWGNWWSSIPKELDKSKEAATPKTAAWYVDGIRNGKPTDSRLVKHLISLRVHLSTAKVAWIEGFLEVDKGMDAFGALLAGLVGKGGRRSVCSLN